MYKKLQCPGLGVGQQRTAEVHSKYSAFLKNLSFEERATKDNISYLSSWVKLRDLMPRIHRGGSPLLKNFVYFAHLCIFFLL